MHSSRLSVCLRHGRSTLPRPARRPLYDTLATKFGPDDPAHARFISRPCPSCSLLAAVAPHHRLGSGICAAALLAPDRSAAARPLDAELNPRSLTRRHALSPWRQRMISWKSMDRRSPLMTYSASAPGRRVERRRRHALIFESPAPPPKSRHPSVRRWAHRSLIGVTASCWFGDPRSGLSQCDAWRRGAD